MDITTLVGLLLSLISLLVAFVMEGGSPLALFGLSAGLIVFGGTIGALIVSYPGAQLKSIPKLFKIAFTNRSTDPLDTIDRLVELATTARREGILSLEDKLTGLSDEFLRSGIQLVVDGVDPELVRTILETELTAMEGRHEIGAGIFESAGGFSPTMGILGTVMGLIHVLSDLSDVSRLGPLIATAFIATLYGVGTANLLWLPIASKLKMRSKLEVTGRELIVEGILSIQAGENPNTLRQKLQVFLPPSARERSVQTSGADGKVGALDA
ncbi:MAG: flagellar motor protein [Acidibacillus sp.]|uniref:Chemotaxis protein PomA n=1 Tax=Sulfoacidibacillus ferrooxidans TaxID=2005001 RepID=A0A9X2ADW8_9BACL|nr:Chemotaxis protein PomA [Sulfoacidibacillus ferrooxidans]MCY0892516.1 flagellar motor protein [Acidibacillus sp.]